MGRATGGTSSCTERGLSSPSLRRHADAGLDNQLAFLHAALDWVAANTPRDHYDPLPGGEGHGLAQRRPAARGDLAQPCARIGVTASAAARPHGPRPARAAGRAARPDGQPAGPRAAAGAGRPDRAPASAPFLSDSLHGAPTATPSTSPMPGGIRSCPRPATSALLWLGAAAAVAMSLGFLTRLARRHDVRGGRLQPLPVDHPLPQQPRVPGDRARAPRAWPLARGRRARGPDLGRWPLWLLRFECSASTAHPG